MLWAGNDHICADVCHACTFTLQPNACAVQAQLNHIDEFDSHKQKSKAQFTQEIFVRATGSDSGKTPSPTITRTPSNASSSSADDDDEDATWFDCVEEFGEQDPNTGLCLEGTSSLQHTALEQAVAALPAKLATIVKKYKQVSISIVRLVLHFP